MAKSILDKPFFELTATEKKRLAAELDRGIPFNKMRPLSRRGKALWAAAKRGRPPKLPGTKAKRVNLTFDPALLAKMNAFTKAKGISRAELVAQGVALAMAK